MFNLIRMFSIFVILFVSNVLTASILQRSTKSINLFPVSIVHINDFHARYVESNIKSVDCKPGEKCIGGYARTATVVKQLLNKNRNKNPIYLNAGDNFQGTIWYAIGRWNITSHFLNLLPADAIALGNHEFDHKIEGIVPYLETIKSPILAANLDASEEPSFQGKFNKSIIIDKYNKKIGIIGVITTHTTEMNDIGKLKFLNESKAIKIEADKLKSQSVDIIIVLSHCGLDIDYIIAKNLGSDIDVIVGGHSHSHMYNVTTDRPNLGPDVPVDTYPAVVETENGHKTLIVQASAYTKFVGDLTVYFDKNGNVANWEGNPIYLDSNIPNDPDIERELHPWKEMIDKISQRKLGISKVEMNKEQCYYGECNLGNFFGDSFVHYYTMNETTENGTWTTVSAAIMNAGGMRTSLSIGEIQYGDLMSCIPFKNTIDLVEIKGKFIKRLFEESVKSVNSSSTFYAYDMTHVSGIRVVYNTTSAPLNRVASMHILSRNAIKPVYEPLEENKIYRIIVPSFIVKFGDPLIRDNMESHSIGPLDMDVVSDYLKYKRIITTGYENRITIQK